MQRQHIQQISFKKRWLHSLKDTSLQAHQYLPYGMEAARLNTNKNLQYLLKLNSAGIIRQAHLW